MDTYSFRIFEMIRQPIVIAFVDMNSDDKDIRADSIDLVDNVLKEVAPAFYHGVIVSYADNNAYYKHRKMMGLTHNIVPALSINNNELKVHPFPLEDDMTVT